MTGSRLEGKLAVITGGSRGQGAAAARRFVEEGASVVIGDVLDDEGARLAGELGDAATYERLDVTESSDWLAVVQRHPDVDVLVNNAGIFQVKKLLETSAALWDRTIAVNQTGPFLGMQAVAKAMIERGTAGSIVNVSSTAGLVGGEAIAYSTSKWALRGLSRATARELGPHGIRVNSIHPGFVETPMLADVPDLDRFLPSIPLGRLAQSEDVADLVLFLASDESSYITGGEFVIDGGWRA